MKNKMKAWRAAARLNKTEGKRTARQWRALVREYCAVTPSGLLDELLDRAAGIA